MAYSRKYMIGVVEEKIESKMLEISTTKDKLQEEVDKLVDFRSEVLRKAANAAGRIDNLTKVLFDLKDEEVWRQLTNAIGSMPSTSRYDRTIQDIEKVLVFQEGSLEQLKAIREALVTSTGDTISVQTAKDLGLMSLLRYTGR